MSSSLLAGRSAQIMERSKVLIAWPTFALSPPIDVLSNEGDEHRATVPCLPVPDSLWKAGQVLLLPTVSFVCIS